MSQIQNEAGLSRLIHSVMHAPTKGRVDWKLQDVFKSGVPDKIICDHGRVGFFEQKYVPLSKLTKVECKASFKFTAEQRRALCEWWDAGGTSFMVLGIGQTVYFIPGTRQHLPQPMPNMPVEDYATRAFLTCPLNPKQVEFALLRCLDARVERFGKNESVL